MSTKKKKNSKGLKAGLIAFGGTFALYAVIFPMYRIWDYVLCAAVSFLVGKVVSIMGSGLDLTTKEEKAKEIPLTGNEEADRLIQKGQEMVAKIQEENKQITDPTLSEQMDQIEATCQKIFKTVSDSPDKAPQVRKFMDYYLPTTQKMMTQFRLLNERGITGQEAQDAKERIRAALAVVVTACQKQLDTLYHNDMLDVTTDIQVLEQMLKRDGLTDSGFGNTVQTSKDGADPFGLGKSAPKAAPVQAPKAKDPIQSYIELKLPTKENEYANTTKED